MLRVLKNTIQTEKAWFENIYVNRYLLSALCGSFFNTTMY